MYRIIRLSQRIKAVVTTACIIAPFFHHVHADAFTPLNETQTAQPTITIIIDDIGNNLKYGRRVLNLPQAVTVAFLPFRPHTHSLALIAAQQQRDIMLHMPMENIANKALGDGALTIELNKETFQHTIALAIESVPGARGINNHMGSLLTTRDIQMQWLMEQVDHYNLYFVDSKTTAQTVAWKVAEQRATPFLRRNVFLDHIQTTQFIAQQFEQLKADAKKYGHAVAIGHPYPETLDFLDQHLASLTEEGFTLVSAYDAVQTKYRFTVPHPLPRDIPMLAGENKEIRLVQLIPTGLRKSTINPADF